MLIKTLNSYKTKSGNAAANILKTSAGVTIAATTIMTTIACLLYVFKNTGVKIPIVVKK